MAIDIRHIRQVDALARHGNFARAAQELGMTQPGLSRAIKTMENVLGVLLFDRNNREITPTVHGQHILEFGKPLMQDCKRLEHDLQQLKEGASGELNIGVGAVPAEIFMGRVMGAMFSQHPHLCVRVIVERPASLAIMLQKREIDVMIGDVREVGDTDGLDITDLPSYPVCFVCNADHPLADSKQMVFKQILDYPIASASIPGTIYTILSEKTGVSVAELKAFKNGLLECDYFTLLIDVVLTSNAIGCGFSPIFADAVASGAMVRLPIDCQGIRSAYGFITLKKYSISPTVQILRRVVGEIVGGGDRPELR